MQAEPPTDPALAACMLKACEDARSGVNKCHGGPFGAMVRHKSTGDTVAVAHNTVFVIYYHYYH